MLNRKQCQLIYPVDSLNPQRLALIEVKQYPQYRAVTYTHAGDVRQATGVAFNPLFQHISSNQIAMTTPVEARYTAIPGQIDVVPQVEVSFLYPSTKYRSQQR